MRPRILSYIPVIFCVALIVRLDFDCFGQKTNIKPKTKSSTKQLSPNEKRRFIEKQIMKGENLHDGSIQLLNFGTISSVPALLKVLEIHPPKTSQSITGVSQKNEENVEKLTPKKSYICTYAHAVAALQKITKQKLIDFMIGKLGGRIIRKPSNGKNNDSNFLSNPIRFPPMARRKL